MNEIIVAIIGLLGTIITVVLVPYIKAKTTKKQRENTYILISKAAEAAEQLFKNIDPTGEKRRGFIVDYLNEKGITVDEYDLLMYRESAVFWINKIKDENGADLLEDSIKEIENATK